MHLLGMRCEGCSEVIHVIHKLHKMHFLKDLHPRSLSSSNKNRYDGCNLALPVHFYMLNAFAEVKLVIQRIHVEYPHTCGVAPLVLL